MFTTNALRKRLDLLHLEEYEVLTEEVPCRCSYFLPDTLTRKEDKGRLYVCSKSLIFESSDENVPIFKYLFRSFPDKPQMGRLDNKDGVFFQAK